MSEASPAATPTALWSRGFRPLFLAASLWAAVAIALWLAFFTGEIDIPTAFSPVDWHVHEMIFGYGAAVVAGFLLTAIPNWTGRLPVAGRPLILLTALWTVGRVAIFFSAKIGWMPAFVLDAAFLATFAIVVGREVIAGNNRRNVRVIILVSLFAAANAAFHIESAHSGYAGVSARAGLAVIVFLILLIGGRVVPSFTNNWLVKQGLAERPVPFGKPDMVVMAMAGVALVLWIAAPDLTWTGGALLVAGAANLWRLSRWHGWATRSDRLVLVLHVGFFFAALGFLLSGAHALDPNRFPAAAGIHVWGVGAVGTMTLAMMTRATLGHTGHALAASWATQLIYLSVIVAALARVAMAFVPAVWMLPLLVASTIAWLLAFLGFALAYGAALAYRTEN